VPISISPQREEICCANWTFRLKIIFEQRSPKLLTRRTHIGYRRSVSRAGHALGHTQIPLLCTVTDLLEADPAAAAERRIFALWR
jgi:hypothetical protein